MLSKGRIQWAIYLVLIYIIASGNIYQKNSSYRSVRNEDTSKLTQREVAQALEIYTFFPELPTELDLKVPGEDQLIRTKFSYTLDDRLQKTMEGLFNLYRPDYGAFVAIDPKDGRILALVSYSQESGFHGNLALRASFPSASIFKIVTAAAAIEEHQVSAETIIPFNGRKHTLFRGQILGKEVTRFTRYISLKEAFAHSINTVFGKMGAFTVGPVGLREYADRFGFNRKIRSDVPVQPGRAEIPEDAWGLAEVASGFTRGNTMSPLQGALIAASVANEGVMMEPFVVQSISNLKGDKIYSASPKVARITMDPTTAGEMRTLMKETILSGTSRGSFRGFFRKDLSFLDVGGKTGSLSGHEPPGKYDWFIGYADSGIQKIAVASLTIHEKQWRVKSSFLARRALESYFKKDIERAKTYVRR